MLQGDAPEGLSPGFQAQPGAAGFRQHGVFAGGFQDWRGEGMGAAHRFPAAGLLRMVKEVSLSRARLPSISLICSTLPPATLTG